MSKACPPCCQCSTDAACLVIRRIAYRLWVTSAAALLLLALLVSLARILLPQAGAYREELVDLLSRQLELPLEVTAIEAQWHGLGPRIRFDGLTLLDRATGRPLLSLRDALVDIDVPRSLWRGSLQISDLSLGGLRLAVVRRGDGSLSVEGLKSSGAPAMDLRGLLYWLQSRKRIALRDTVVDWRDEMKGGVVRHFHQVVFKLRNQGQRHQVEGRALLGETSAQGFSFAMDIRGDVLRAGAWDADLYLETRDLRLEDLPWPLTLSGVRLGAGNASMSVWGHWSRARLQRLDGRLALRALRLADAAPGRGAMSYAIDELGGDFTWQRAAGGWRLAVADLRFAREGRRWPQAKLQVAREGGESAPVTARLAYLDLGDLHGFLRLGPLLPPSLAEPLAALQPRGRMRDAYLRYGATDAPRFYLAARFEGVGVAPWRGAPTPSKRAAR